jgi:hypothetical protein
MVEELGVQYTAAGRSHGGFSIELLILYCLGKQLTSKQASGRDFEANKQASRELPNRVIKQAEECFACLLISKSASPSLSASLFGNCNGVCIVAPRGPRGAVRH